MEDALVAALERDTLLDRSAERSLNARRQLASTIKETAESVGLSLRELSRLAAASRENVAPATVRKALTYPPHRMDILAACCDALAAYRTGVGVSA